MGSPQVTVAFHISPSPAWRFAALFGMMENSTCAHVVAELVSMSIQLREEDLRGGVINLLLE